MDAINSVTVTVTAVDMDTVGWSTGRAKADEVREYRFEADYASKTWQFALMGGAWYGLCWKCGGGGNIGYGPDNGVCYECLGTGVRDYWSDGEEFLAKLRNVERYVKGESTKQRKAIEKRQAEIAAWRAANPEIVAWAEALPPTGTEPNDYVPSETQDVFDGYSPAVQVAIRSLRYGSDLDRKNTGLIRKVMGDEANAPAEATTSRHAGAEGERLAITGKVVMVRGSDDGAYLSVKVEGEGADTGLTFFTNTSSASAYELEEGDLVTIKGTIKRNEVYRVTGQKSDRVGRAVFTKVTEVPAAPVAKPAETAPQAPVEAPEAPVAKVAEAPASPAAETASEAPAKPVAKPARSTGRREALGASTVDGWDLLYDKPKDGAEVVRKDGRYALACKAHKTLHHLDRLTDERKVRAAGGWCTDCH